MTARQDLDIDIANPSTSFTKETTLHDLFFTVLEARWFVLGIIALVLLIGSIKIFTAPYVYQADALVHIEKSRKSLALELSDLFPDETLVSSEMVIFKSRTVLGEVVDSLKLDYVARPLHFPYLGSLSTKIGDTTRPKASWLGLDKYAWGGEKIKVETFDIPEQFRGQLFTLVAGQEGNYRLLSPQLTLLLEGKVGAASTITLTPDDEEITLFVSELKARPGTYFELIRKPRLQAIMALKGSINVEETTKDSSILEVSIEGSSPDEVTTILNEIANVYLRQNVEYKSAEAQNSLAFLETHLPTLKDQLDNAEVALNAYRSKQGSVDLPLQTQAFLNRSVELQSGISELNREREELLQKFKPEHPRVVVMDVKISGLNIELNTINEKVQKLPNTQQQILKLSRDVKVSTKLYTELLDKSQELKVIKAGTVGNVRIIDRPVPPLKPIRPNKQFLFMLYLSFGVLLGVGLVLIRKAIVGGVEDPDVVEAQFGLPVYATIPHSKVQDKLSRSKSQEVSVLTSIRPDDAAIESLRSLRTSLHFALFETKSKIIMITGPRPEVGKTFISTNLAAVLASTSDRVLLIDADMRKGQLHKDFGMKRGEGLSELVANKITIEKAMRWTPISNLCLISTGDLPPNPAELLMHERFETTLNTLADLCDYVIVDTPPVLSVTDATIIGRFAGATLLVIKSGVHPLRELDRCIKQLKQANANLRGAVLNNAIQIGYRYGYGKYYGYGQSYSPKKTS